MTTTQACSSSRDREKEVAFIMFCFSFIFNVDFLLNVGEINL